MDDEWNDEPSGVMSIVFQRGDGSTEVRRGEDGGEGGGDGRMISAGGSSGGDSGAAEGAEALAEGVHEC